MELRNIKIEDYNYPLPDEMIPKFPLEKRDLSKLLVFNNREISADTFKNIADHIESNSLIVFNNTRVIHARLEFRRETGARIEILCIEPHRPAEYNLMFQSQHQCEWLCMVGNLKKWKKGILEMGVTINGSEICLMAEKTDTINNSILIRFNWNGEATFSELIEAAGKLPLPPYLNREAVADDDIRYQTIYSREQGSVAAPTAGLHFTEEVFDSLLKKGVKQSFITLHVGAGTFKPVKSDYPADHEMHTEHYSVPLAVIEQIISKNGPLVAVGTTSVRTLESLYWLGIKTILNPSLRIDELNTDQWEPYNRTGFEYDTPTSLGSLVSWMRFNKLEVLNSSTRIIILPGYKFRITDTIITNFHQPKSTLLLLIAAWTGDEWKNIYRFAIENGFRFLSYGDSSILFRGSLER